MPLCSGIKADGKRCERKVEKQGDYCFQHKKTSSRKSVKSPRKSPVKSPRKSPVKSPRKSPVKSPRKSPRRSPVKSSGKNSSGPYPREKNLKYVMEVKEILSNTSFMTNEQLKTRISLVPFPKPENTKSIPFVILEYAEKRMKVNSEMVEAKVKPVSGFTITVLEPEQNIYVKGVIKVVQRNKNSVSRKFNRYVPSEIAKRLKNKSR